MDMLSTSGYIKYNDSFGRIMSTRGIFNTSHEYLNSLDPKS